MTEKLNAWFGENSRRMSDLSRELWEHPEISREEHHA